MKELVRRAIVPLEAPNLDTRTFAELVRMAQSRVPRYTPEWTDFNESDPGNTLTREEITAKALRLAAFSGGATAVEMQAAVDALWGVAEWPRVPMRQAILDDRFTEFRSDFFNHYQMHGKQ